MGLARSTYYAGPDCQFLSEAHLLERIFRIKAEFPFYGYRRVTAALRQEGLAINRRKVLRLMKEKGLFAKMKRRYIHTTDSNHDGPIFPNLAKGIVPDGPNQLWVADITFVGIAEGFVYLAVILDAWSRRVLGYPLGTRITTRLALAALRAAIDNRTPPAGLVHHPDRGSQYASNDYRAELESHGIKGSMSRRGNPYDNAKAESFMKTLKQEEVDGSDYRDINVARRHIGRFIETVYNRQRLHSALNYLSPMEFEGRPLPSADLVQQKAMASTNCP